MSIKFEGFCLKHYYKDTGKLKMLQFSMN